MKYFRWSHYAGGNEEDSREVWSLDIRDKHFDEWDVMSGTNIKHWYPNLTAYYEESNFTDYPFITGLIPVYSPRLRSLIENMKVNDIQYLPLRIKRKDEKEEISGYSIANYLRIIECLNRERSVYQLWTKDNLLFWEKRPDMLGTFESITKTVLDLKKIGDARIFRLWGWEVMVVLREDIKQAIEKAGITGCEFSEIEVI
jgi:hypothetical protein